MKSAPQDEQNIARILLQRGKTRKETLVASAQTGADLSPTEQAACHAEKLEAVPLQIREDFCQNAQMIVAEGPLVGSAMFSQVRQTLPRPAQERVFTPGFTEYRKAVRAKHAMKLGAGNSQIQMMENGV